MSNTPRTDAAVVTMLRLDGDADVVVAAFFARQLERELIAARSATAAIPAMPTEEMVTKGVEAMIAYIFNDAPGEMLAMDGRREAMRVAYIAMVKAADSQGTAPPVEEGATDPMENWLMRGALEWLEQAEHGGEKERCKNIAVLLRTLWRGDKQNLQPVAPGSSYMKKEQP